MLETLTADHFKDHIQHIYKVTLPHTDIELTLVEAEEQQRSSSRQNSKRSPFSLILLGPMNAVLTQGTYPMELLGLGRAELFIVPVGPTPDRAHMRYQILFS